MQELAYKRTDIEETMRSAYLSYAMSVITARALPDVRDGLKPVQRRILYAMDDMGLRHDRPTRKSARIVGEVLGKYHPHGDIAVYEAMVRMAQDFSMRYLLVDGQGNFGSVDGDGAAAVRYTEARLSVMGDEMLTDLDKDAVDMTANFDGTLKEPLVLPAKLPNLLVNGVGGIAVGMATNIPPHNLSEIADAIAYLVDRYHQAEDVTLDELMQFVKGPDFPTGGTILGDEGIRQAYATGRGRVVMRSQVHPEELSGGRVALIVTELPYQVNKSTLVGRIATLAREGRVDGIGDLRDESDRMGIRIVIELKRGVEWEPVLASLLKYSQLQATFGVNMLALVDGEPRTLSLKRALLHYIDHRYTVVERRSRFELEKARQRAHILEGLLIALDHLDEVIDTIRRSRTAETAKENLCKRFSFTEVQSQAILDLQLRRLAALERRKVQEEYREVIERIAFLQDLLSSEAKIRAVVKAEILDLKRLYGDARRTRVSDLLVSTDVSAGDLVVDADLVVAVTTKGRVRQAPVSLCHAGEGGLIERLVTAHEPVLALARTNAQQKVVFITHTGRAFGLGAHQIPDIRQQPDGVAVESLAQLEPTERVVAAIAIDRETQDKSLAIATADGRLKRVTIADLNAVNRDLVNVIGLVDQDTVVGAVPTDADTEVLLVTAQGRVIRFSVVDVRPQGLPAQGIKGIDLKVGDSVVGLDVVRDGAELLIATANGFAKRSLLSEYPPQGRGGQGSVTVDLSKNSSTGPIAGACVVSGDDQVLFGTVEGSVVSHAASMVPRLARDTWGRVVTRTRSGAVVALPDGGRVTGCARLAVAADSGPAISPPGLSAAEDDGDDGPPAPEPNSTERSTRRARPSASPSAANGASSAARPPPGGKAKAPSRTSLKPQGGVSAAEPQPVRATGKAAGPAKGAGRGAVELAQTAPSKAPAKGDAADTPASPAQPARSGRAKKATTGPADEILARSSSAGAQQAPADGSKEKSPAKPKAQARTAHAGRNSGAQAEPMPAVESTGPRGRKGTSTAGALKTGPVEAPPSQVSPPREVRQPRLPEAAPATKAPSARRRAIAAPAPVAETPAPGKASSAVSTAESRALSGTGRRLKVSEPEAGVDMPSEAQKIQANGLARPTVGKASSVDRRTAPAAAEGGPPPATTRTKTPATESLPQVPRDPLHGSGNTGAGETPSSPEGRANPRGTARGVRQVPKRKRTGE